jgi:3-oxoacyl-[acyl-carrier protein] reductase
MRLALLTGVGKKGQVGEAVAERLAADGFDLVLVDRTPAGVNERADELRRSGRNATAYSCDLADPEAVTSLLGTIGRVHGSALQACVHMAGGFAATGPVAGSEPSAWDRQLTINLRTAFLVARSSIPLLRSGRGSMVFFTSDAALPGAKLSGISGYGVAKAALVSLAIAIAQEEQQNGIRVNLVAPAAIRTSTNLSSMGSADRFVALEDVSATVSYLCSDASRALTGQVLRLVAI